MYILKILLIPFTVLYALAAIVIDLFYRKEIWGTSSFNLPVIAIGNLTTGGTGKTPMVIFLAKMLRSNYKVGIISRGYKRKTFGFRIVSDEDSFEMVGDEPAMIKKLMPELIIAVAENRILGIPQLLAEHPEIDLLILDDAFQQRGIRPALNILLSAAHRPFHKDYLLPYGGLRECRKGAERADMIVMTKCEQASEEYNSIFIREQNLPVQPHQSLFSTEIVYGKVYQLICPGEGLPNSDKMTVLAFAGIADEKPLKDYLETKFEEVFFIKYPDHYRYSDTDLEKIFQIFEQIESSSKVIITTEKDAIKLEKLLEKRDSNQECLYVLPIDLSFGTIEQESRFKNSVHEVIEKII